VLQITSCGRNFTKVRKAITSGYFTHAAKKDPQEGYKTMDEGQVREGGGVVGPFCVWGLASQFVVLGKRRFESF
jgi:hypothetical protein